MANSNVALIVDDEKDIGWLLSGILKNLGFEVFCALSLQEAREVLQNEQPPEVVLLDIHLPDGTGFELVNDIRERNTHSQIIVQSAYDGAQEHELLQKHKIEYFLPKPINIQKLKQYVAQ